MYFAEKFKAKFSLKTKLFYVFCPELCQIFIISKDIQNWFENHGQIHVLEIYGRFCSILKNFQTSGAPLFFDSACLLEILIYSLIMKHYLFILPLIFKLNFNFKLQVNFLK